MSNEPAAVVDIGPEVHAQAQVQAQAQPQPPAQDQPRLCPTCQRPIRALDRSEYTERRADLVIERGLCVCGEPEA